MAADERGTDGRAHPWSGVALAGVVALCLVWGGLNAAKAFVNRGGSDFAQHYLAGARVLDHQVDRLYEVGPAYDAYGRSKGLPRYGDARGADTGYVTNAYPPIATLPFVPLALLPFAWAFRLFTLLNLLALAGTVLLLARPRAPPERHALLAAGAALVLLLQPAWYGLTVGQVNPLLLLACVAAHRLSEERPLAAGALLAAAGLIKLFPFLLVPWWLAQGRTRPAVIAVIVAAAVVLLGLPLFPPAVWSHYARHVLPGMLSAGAHPANHGFTGVLSRLLTDNPWVVPLAHAPTLAAVLAKLGAVAVVVTALALAVPARGERARDLAFGLALAAIPLAASKSWEHYAVYLLPAWLLVLEALRAPRDRRERALRLATLASFVVWAFVLRPPPSVDLKALGVFVQPLLAVKFVASLTAFVSVALVTHQASRIESGGEQPSPE